jgi:2-aminoethylphosphonate-pyruvate transaminase
MIREACILAAGRGVRLGERGEQVPKGFLRLGERAIVEESLIRLRRAGIERVVIVTGHLAHFYGELAGVDLVHNPRYAESGSLYSLSLALEVLRGDFLLLESDLIYEDRALQVLQEDAGPNQLLASGPTGAGDEVWVESRDGALLNLSKQRDGLQAGVFGEFVGINRLSRTLPLRAAAERLLEASFLADYESGLVACGSSFRCRLVEDLLWAEIDDPGMQERARRMVYPSLPPV